MNQGILDAKYICIEERVSYHALIISTIAPAILSIDLMEVEQQGCNRFPMIDRTSVV